MRRLSKPLFTAAAVLFAAAVVAAEEIKAPAARQAAEPMCCMNDLAPMDRIDAYMTRMKALHGQVAAARSAEDRPSFKDDPSREMPQGMAIMRAMLHGGPMAGAAGIGTLGQKEERADQGSQLRLAEKPSDRVQ